ncbi:MAG: hypothetical protein QE271_01105 [Bacteriovoracaceae bacterium]|nr:hypothetical protein [Bacteriovoracaceae bacterium]
MKGWFKNTFCYLSLVLFYNSAFAQSRSPAQSILPEQEIVQPNKFEATTYQKYVLNEKHRLDSVSQQIKFWNTNDEFLEKWDHGNTDAYHASVSNERTEFLKAQLLRFFFKSASKDVETSINQNLNNWKYSFAGEQNAKVQEELLNKDSSQEFTVDQAMYRSLMNKDSPDMVVNLQKKNGNSIAKEFKIKNRFQPLRGIMTSTMEFRNTQLSMFVPITGRFELNFNNLKPIYGFNLFYNYNVRDKRILTGVGRPFFFDTYLRYTYSRDSILNDKTISLSYSYNF